MTRQPRPWTADAGDVDQECQDQPDHHREQQTRRLAKDGHAPYRSGMCRSIKTLRRPGEVATTGELEAAARQFVRKVSGYREPSARNQEAFEAAIATSPPRAAGSWRPSVSTSRMARTTGSAVTAWSTPGRDDGRRAVVGPPGLDVVDGRLTIAGRDPEALVREHGTPLFAYDLARFGENARAIQAAFSPTGLPFQLRFALKASPFPEVLGVFRSLGAPGRPAQSVSTRARPARCCRALECAAGGPTRSATPARTSPTAISTCC